MHLRTSCRFLSVVIVLSAIEPVSAQTTQPSPNALELPADFYPILPWDCMHGWYPPYAADASKRIESAKESGFTMAGFVEAKDLPLCEKLGLKAILAPPMDDPTPAWGPWRKLTDEQIDARVRTMVANGGNSPALIGYFLMDEPGTPFFAALGKATAAVKKHAPGKLAYVNLFPSYATIGAPDQSQLGAKSFTEYLERFVAEVKPQLLSYDNYAIQSSDDGLHAPGAASYYRDLLDVRRVAHQHGLPWWNIAASAQITPEFPPPSPSNLLLQAYTTLAAGANGLCWYTYLGGYPVAPLDAADRPQFIHPFLRAVNRQVQTLGPIMNRMQSTGVYFTSPAPDPSLPVLPGRIMQSVESRASIRKLSDAKPAIMVGEFAGDDGADYAMIVNLSVERPAHVTFQTQREYAKREYFEPADGRRTPWNPKGQWLVAGQGVLVRLK
jgi:hypothetical protein